MASTSSPIATTEPASSPATGTATAPATESAHPPTTTSTTATSASEPVDVPISQSQQQQQLDAPMQPESMPAATPVEMSTLGKDNAATTAPATTTTTTPAPAAGLSTSSQTDPLASSSSAPADAVDADSLALTVTIMAVDGPRHPIKLSSNYLVQKRINAEANDPMNMRVIQLKDLIWGEWQPSWPARPTSPTSIRLISFGKVLDDESLLKDNKFNRETGNIVHMAVKPQELVDEEDAKGAHSSRPRSTQDRSPGCRCVIM